MKNNDFNIILNASVLYKKEKDLEFYFNEKETCIFVIKVDKKSKKEMLFSPESHYKFINVKLKDDLLFIGVKGEVMTSFIYSLKNNSFLKNPINEKSYSFYPGFIKKEDILILNCKGYRSTHKEFCTKTHTFLSL